MTRNASSAPAFTPIGLAPSFGFGDRLGLATPGHIAAFNEAATEIIPIFPQQSIREMIRTRRTPQQVIDDALRGMRQANYTGPAGADADHLKTLADVDSTAAAGFCFFTIDPSDHVDPHASRYDAETLAQKFRDVAGVAHWVGQYLGRSIRLSTGTPIQFDETTCRRAAVKYGRAIEWAISLATHIDHVMRTPNRPYEIELSVDETPEPTTPAEHYIIAEQCQVGGMKLISLAPRFIGDFEKGVDYKGDIAALQRSLTDHAAIAQQLGPYKLSLHSGSDKLSIYPAFAQTTRGQFHIKTAGTSYLEALRVMAHHEPRIFRAIIDFSRQCYDRDRATYHVSARLADLPSASQITEPIELERLYLQRWEDTPPGTGFTAPGRQVLHTTYGSVLNHASLGREFIDALSRHADAYTQILQVHFQKHLCALR